MEKDKPAPRYIDPTTDYGFKRIFGEEANKDLLIAFLNDLFRGRKVIKSLLYKNTERVGDAEGLGAVIFDLICRGGNGEEFVIEVQRRSHPNIIQRMLYYGCRLVAGQGKRGARAGWGYRLREVYVIVIMDGFAMSGGGNGRVLHDCCFCDRETGQILYDGFGLIFLELANFRKTEEDIARSDTTDLDRWLYVLKNMSQMDRLSAYLRKPIFEKLFNIAEYSKLNREEREMYDVSLKRKWDRQMFIDDARMEGLREGRMEGQAEGRRAVAREMKKAGLPVDQIILFSGLSAKEIEKL